MRVQGVTRGIMSENTAVDTVSGLDYEEIEEAVMETARGRWFLTEFARRQRGADTRILLDAIRRLEDQLLSLPATISAAPDMSPLVAEAEGELHRLSGTGATGADGTGNARDIAARLATITGSLRTALNAPDGSIAERIKPEIDRLDACTSEQGELADKLVKAAQLVRQLRAGNAAINCTPAAQPRLAEPEPLPTAAPAVAQPPAAKPSAPAFVPSDDDIFEAAPARPVPAPVAQNPLANSALASDTLNFSSIEVPPLPDSVPADEENAIAAEAPCAPAAEGPASASPHIEEPAPEPLHKANELKARDRVIQVTRSGSRMSPPPGPRTAMATNGRISMSNPAAANTSIASNAVAADQLLSSGNPVAAGPRTSSNGSSGSDKNKRIIVIRRPAGGTDSIPLAGEGFDGDGPGAA